MPTTQPIQARTVRLIALLALSFAVAGCQTNAATGRNQLVFISPQQEQQIGDEQHPKLVEAFGGEYEGSALDGYVSEVGHKLDIHAETPDVRYSFTVLDSDIANAFALPGGYVHISRGLLVLMNNEAELASVLGHEIGHVTARHSAERQATGTLTRGGVIAAAVLTGSSEVGRGLDGIANVALASYSRGQESESDRLGLRYMNKAGYDPDAMADMLKQLGANGALLAKLAGKETAQQFDILSTHPQTPQRIADAKAAAASIQSQGEDLGTDRFLAAIDGMVFGPGPSDGAVRGQRYGNLEDRVTWTAPEGFAFGTGAGSATLVQGANDTVVLYDSVSHPPSGSAQAFLTQVWAAKYRLNEVERVDVNGFTAATGILRGVRTRTGVRDVRLMAIALGEGHYARFTIQTVPQYTAGIDRELQRLVYSFRRLEANEDGLFQPRRVRIVTVKAGDTVQSLAQRMAVDELPEDWFRTINGLDPGQGVSVGQKVKLVADG